MIGPPHNRYVTPYYIFPGMEENVITLDHLHAQLEKHQQLEDVKFLRVRLRGMRCYNRRPTPQHVGITNEGRAITEAALSFADSTGTLLIAFVFPQSDYPIKTLQTAKTFLATYNLDAEYILEVTPAFAHAKRQCDSEKESKFYGTFILTLLQRHSRLIID